MGKKLGDNLCLYIIRHIIWYDQWPSCAVVKELCLKASYGMFVYDGQMFRMYNV